MNLFDIKYEPQNQQSVDDNHAKPKSRRDALIDDWYHQKGSMKDYKCYGLTFKYMNKENPTLDDYKKLIVRVQQRSDLFNYVYEEKSKNGSPCKGHIHGVAYFKTTPRFAAFSEYGLHTRFELIYNFDGWHRYAMKNT